MSRLFDLPFQPFAIATGERIDGRLPTDRPHVFKFYGAYTQEWNGRHSTEFSGFTTAQSGTPLTTILSLYSLSPAVVYGQGDLGRTEAFTSTDFAVRHKVRFKERFTFVADLDILNLFDERNVFGVANAITPNNLTGTALGFGGGVAGELATFNAIFNGGINTQLNNYLANRPDRTITSYRQANSFQAAREVRFGFRLLF